MVKLWKNMANRMTPLAHSPGRWRGLFNESIHALGLDAYGFRPYSLRRGGATFWFGKHQSLDRILVSGRWQTQKSARIYINEGLALLAGMNIPQNAPNIWPFYKVYCQCADSPKFSTLEPPAVGGRSGGSGKRKNLGRKRVSKNRFVDFSCNILLYFQRYGGEEVWLGAPSVEWTGVFSVRGLAQPQEAVSLRE